VIVQKYNIKTFFDVPCGDFNWFRHIVEYIPNYIGGDIVKEIITKNRDQYDYTFLHFDLVNDAIPSDVDIVFCRDVFVHLPLDAIIKALKNIKRSNAKYIFMTTFINRPFQDTYTGGWRAISFFDPPFSFPQPLTLINENCPQSYPAFIDKSMGLWLIKDIPDF
jgi:SAM-dependent methyltransferase